LGAPHDIKKIVLWNRQDVGLYDRLSFATVFLLDKEGKVNREVTIGNATGITRFAFSENTNSPRFVEVTLDGAKRYLSLSEVQVFDESGQDVALASRGAEASQSSNYYSSIYPGDFGAGNAIDGVTSTGITHTFEELNPWWKVDLGAPHDIKKIVLWNRQDVGLSDRLSYATVSLLDSDKKSIAEMSIGDATGIEKFELDFNWTSVLTLK